MLILIKCNSDTFQLKYFLTYLFCTVRSLSPDPIATYAYAHPPSYSVLLVAG